MPQDTLTATGSSYHPFVGMIMIFNLVVGTGALALPHAFQSAGWLVSGILLCIIAFFAFITATFVVEAMAIGNAVIYYRKRREEAALENGSFDRANIDESDCESVDEQTPLHRSVSSDRLLQPVSHPSDRESPSQWSPFEIRYRVELGRLATIFFGRVGQTLFYIAMAIYLYGDLAIYATAVPTSLLRVTCTYNRSSENCTAPNVTMSDPCWSGVSLTQFDVYRLYVMAFILLLGPFAFFNVQKTMLIQIVTSVLRWVSLLTMICLACILLAGPQGGHGSPKIANVDGIPNLFGSAVYSFMCHHSLPSLVTPIRQKRRVNSLLGGDFVIILLFYLFLTTTGVFAFHSLNDLYSLNFAPGFCDGGSNPQPATTFVPVQYFISLFPVFTISASFPIIAITLRNNIHSLVLAFISYGRKPRRTRSTPTLLVSSPAYGSQSDMLVPHHDSVRTPPMRPPDRHKLPFLVERVVLPLSALGPPVILAMITYDVQFLVSITGSYAGAFVQYFIPVALVFYGRRRLTNFASLLPPTILTKNPHSSPFGHMFWLILVCIWAVASIALVTVDHIISGK